MIYVKHVMFGTKNLGNQLQYQKNFIVNKRNCVVLVNIIIVELNGYLKIQSLILIFVVHTLVKNAQMMVKNVNLILNL